MGIPANYKDELDKVTYEAISGLEICSSTIIELFCIKHDISFCGWSENIPCGIGFFGDYVFGWDDVFLDIATRQPKGLILKWFSDSLSASLSGCTRRINFKSYTMGYRFDDLIEK
jgi:hypothetical protein